MASTDDRAPEPGYAEWNARTYYSFLRGGSSPRDLATAAAELGLAAIAVTDLHGVYGMPKLWEALREIPNAPKLLVGAEIPIAEVASGSLAFIAKTRRGYAALCRILTEAHRERPKGASALSPGELRALLRETPGADALFLFPQWEEVWEDALQAMPHPRRDLGARLADRMLEGLSWAADLPAANAVLPLSRRIDGFDRERTETADRLARAWCLPLVAHNRVLYHDPDQRRVHDTLTCIREGVSFRDAGYRLRRNTEAYLKSPREMRALFSDRPELVETGLRLAEECVFLPSELRYRYPSEWIPSGMSAQTYLESLCAEGQRKRYPRGADEASEAQLRYELKLIGELGYADYFLTVYDVVRFARERGILCQGRGSAANSIICYVLGVTAIDPVKMDLLFERFISVERNEPPDIDVDFEHERREEVIQYVYGKYGRDRAAMVSAVITYRERSALRETAKAYGVDVGTLSAKQVQLRIADPGRTDPALAARIEQTAGEIADFPRHLSIHSGGFTLSADPIVEIVPVEPAAMEGRTIVQWDKYDLDILGLLKVDLLSLGMLSALRKSLQLVGRELHEIPHDDAATYEMIQRADTIGTFQIESRAQMAMLPRLKPENFYDLVIEVALVRPGPIVGKMVHPYLKRRRGEEEWTLPHPALGPILGRTFGVPIFQEQVMKMAIAIAGFTPGEADKLRKAIGAWRSSGSIDVMGQKLKDGLMRANIPEDFSQRIFDQIRGFSEYGFPESHAASFALLAYASCWIKRHHPAEFLVAMLNSQPMGFYAPHTLVDDAKRHGVEVRSISLEESDWFSKMEVGDGGTDRRAVRIGFHQVNGMSEQEWEWIRRARESAPFRDFDDFAVRVHAESDGRGIKRNLLRGLALADVFRGFGLSQREALWKALSFETVARTRLFQATDLFASARFAEMSEYEAILTDYREIGLSTRGHPMQWIRRRVPGRLGEMNSRRAKEAPNGCTIAIPGLSLVMQRPPTAAGTAFATLEDEFGFLDLVLHKGVYEKTRDLMAEEPFVVVRGTVQRDGLSASLVVRDVKPFLPAPTPGGDFEDEAVAKFEGEGEAPGAIRIPDSPGSLARRHLR